MKKVATVVLIATIALSVLFGLNACSKERVSQTIPVQSNGLEPMEIEITFDKGQGQVVEVRRLAPRATASVDRPIEDESDTVTLGTDDRGLGNEVRILMLKPRKAKYELSLKGKAGSRAALRADTKKKDWQKSLFEFTFDKRGQRVVTCVVDPSKETKLSVKKGGG